MLTRAARASIRQGEYSCPVLTRTRGAVLFAAFLGAGVVVGEFFGKTIALGLGLNRGFWLLPHVRRAGVGDG